MRLVRPNREKYDLCTLSQYQRAQSRKLSVGSHFWAYDASFVNFTSLKLFARTQPWGVKIKMGQLLTLSPH